MRTAIALLAIGFVACNGDDDTDTDIDTEVDTGTETPEETTARMFAELVTTTDAPTGDGSCYTPGEAWNTQVADPLLQADETRGVVIADFQSGGPVAGATLSVFEGDDVTATADTIIVADGDGEAEITAPSCTPIGVKAVATDTKDTYQSHLVFEPLAEGDGDVINSVSNATYTLIPSVLGVSVDEDKSVVAGAVYDCNGDTIQNAQIVVRDADGNIPGSLVVNYFGSGGLPSRDQEASNADGLWVAMNVPAGSWTAEAYVSDGAGGHELIGATELETFADSINIASIHTGFGDGVALPASCVAVEVE